MKQLCKGLLIMMLLAAFSSCGGGGGTTTPPPNPNQDDQNSGGDFQEVTIPGQSQGNFSLPGGAAFGDLRGVAVSQNHVYVADAENTYCFNKLGTFLRSTAAPQDSTIKGIATFPQRPQVPGLEDEYDDFFLANHPVIIHTPLQQYGYITIYGPTLDFLADRPDSGRPDAARFIALPNAADGIVPPAEAGPCVFDVFDIKVDRYGSILATVELDYDVQCGDPASHPEAVQIFSVFNNFSIVDNGIFNDPGNPDNDFNGLGIKGFHRNEGANNGRLGTFTPDTFFPYNRTETLYNFYTASSNLQRDYVGVAQVSLNTNAVTPLYGFTQIVNNGFGYDRIIGASYGSIPGSFSLDPPLNPDGGLEDPDIAAGGPSYMGIDRLTDNLYVCDPGNRRVQIFEAGTGDYLGQIGNGTRGTAGNTFLCPSRAEVDFDGTVFICDVNQLRVFRPNQPDRTYGGVGGTVTDLVNGNRLQGATVTIGNEQGTLGSVFTNINGQYAIANLLTGTYYVTCTKFNYGTDFASIQVLPDQQVVANFNLRPNVPATLGGYTGTLVNSATNLPVVGALVEILTTSLTTTSDGTGAFGILNIPPGIYQARFSAPGLQTETRQIEILAGQIRNEQVIEMDPA